MDKEEQLEGRKERKRKRRKKEDKIEVFLD
jgi:hypothetical protein